MEDGTNNSSAVNLDGTVAVSASAMVNPSEMISTEAYQANLKRIQQMKDFLRQIEENNDTAHKKYVMDQLQKRVNEGREAEEALARLRSSSTVPDNSSFVGPTSNNNQHDVILPTTATVVEVPEGSAPRSSPLHATPAQPSPFYNPPPVQQQPTQQYHHYRPHIVPSQQAAPSTFHTQPTSTSYNYAPLPTNRRPSQEHQTRPQSRDQAAGKSGQQVFRLDSYQQGATPTPWYPPVWGMYDYSQYPQVRQLAPTWNVANIATTQQPMAGYSGSVRQGKSATSSSRGGMSAPANPPVQVNISQAPNGNVQGRPSSGLPSRDQHNSHPAAATQVRPTHTETGPTSQQSGHPHRPQVPSQPSMGQLPRPIQPRQSDSRAAPPVHSQPIPPNPPPNIGPQTVHPAMLQNQFTQVPQTNNQPHAFIPWPPQAQQSGTRSTQPVHTQAIPSNPPPNIAQTLRPAAAQNQQPNSQSQVPQPRSQPQSVKTTGPSPTTQSQSGVTPSIPQPNSNVTKDAFIHEFQQAVKAGPEHVRRLWTLATKAGVSQDWFIAAINSIPGPSWQYIKSVFLQQDAPRTTVGATSKAQGQVSSAPSQTSAQASQSTQNAPQTIRLGTPPRDTYSAAVTAQPKAHADGQAEANPATQIGTIAFTPGPHTTPERSKPNEPLLPRTPQQADKARLARDILRSLGRPLPVPVKEKEKVDEPQVNESHQEGEKQVASEKIVAGKLPMAPITTPPSTTIVPIAVAVAPSEVPITVSSDSATPVAISQVLASSVFPIKPSPPPEIATLDSQDSQPSLPEPPAQPDAASIGQQDRVVIDLTVDDSTASAGASSPKTTNASEVSPRPASPRSASPAAPDPTPQLQRLSLHETSIQTRTEDVRMVSPHLSPSFKVGPLVPPSTSAEPVGAEATSSNLQALPGASENSPDGNLPLFLPSPPGSPRVSDGSSAPVPPETDDEAIVLESVSKPSLKRRSTEVEDVEGGALPSRVKKRRKQVYVLVPPPSPSLRNLIDKAKKGRARSEDVISDSEEEEVEPLYTHLERVVIEESKSRLMERRCRWLNCDAVLNCGQNLLVHLRRHCEEASKLPSHCKSKGCRKRLRTNDELDVHLERHAVFPLPCPFAGCDEEFDSPIEVMHHEVEHQNNTGGQPLVRRSTPKPFVPSIPAKLGRPPQRLPSYRVLPRRVVKSRISADRHAVVGPWVLWHIFSPVNLNMRKQNGTMRGRPPRQIGMGDGDDTEGTDEYDFLVPVSPASSRLPPLDDLDCPVMTQFASYGLVLWAPNLPPSDLEFSPHETVPRNDGPTADGPVDTAPGPELDTTITKMSDNSEEAPQIESIEVDPSPSTDAVPEGQLTGDSVGSGEEEDVERMLVM